MVELDRADIALLRAVQKNNRLTSEELAGVVHLSPTACQRRLRRLRSEGVIEGDVSIVSPKAVGRHVTMIVMVSLERERADIVDRFKAAIRNTREVMKLRPIGPARSLLRLGAGCCEVDRIE